MKYKIELTEAEVNKIMSILESYAKQALTDNYRNKVLALRQHLRDGKERCRKTFIEKHSILCLTDNTCPTIYIGRVLEDFSPEDFINEYVELRLYGGHPLSITLFWQKLVSSGLVANIDYSSIILNELNEKKGTYSHNYTN